MTNITDSISSELYQRFFNAILDDYDNGAIDRTQVTIALQYLILMLRKQDFTSAERWLREGRKNIRQLNNKPNKIVDEFWE